VANSNANLQIRRILFLSKFIYFFLRKLPGQLSRRFYRANNDFRKSSKVIFSFKNSTAWFKLLAAVSILGPFTFILGLARDYLAFGWCRAICFCVLIFSYLMMAFAEPGKSDWMLYFWILQFVSGTTLMIRRGWRFLMILFLYKYSSW